MEPYKKNAEQVGKPSQLVAWYWTAAICRRSLFLAASSGGFCMALVRGVEAPHLPHAVVTHDDGVLLRVQDSTFPGKLAAPLLELGKWQVHEPWKADKGSEEG